MSSKSNPRSVLITFVLLIAGVIGASCQPDTPFVTPCGAMPFQSIAVEHKGVDDVCGIDGVTSPGDVGNIQQNAIKNNFCLKSDPVQLKPQDLITLQKKVDALQDFKFGSGRSVPKDRTPLHDIATFSGTSVGEGVLVQVVGYMVDPHYSDVKAGEGVNCKKHGNEPNDIHFSIASKWIEIDDSNSKAKQAQLCKLVTGEISPHYRPETWEVSDLTQLERIPLRLTGQLFFDASHVPCRPGKPVNPARASVWEIHPIYAIDVCKSKNQCRVSVASDWIPLNEWVEAQHEQNVSEKDESQ